MDVTTLMKLIVGLIVTVVLTSVLLVSVVAEGVAETCTYTNEGMPFAAVDDDTHTITITASEITVDGETIDQTLFPSGFTAYTIVYGESSFVRYIVSNSTIQYCYTSQTSFAIGDNTVTVTIAGDSATITTTADETTATMTDVLYYISTEGTYVLSNCPYVLEDSILYGGGSTYFSSTGSTVYTVWTGTIEGITAEAIRSTIGTAVVSSVDINTTNTVTNLYRIDSVLINYSLTANNTDHEATSTYTYFLAPSEVVYDNPLYVGSTNAALLNIVPLIVLVGLVLGVIGTAISRRD